MKSAGINEIRKELQTLEPKQLLEFCLRLSRYKKENKELLGYLLFDAHDEPAFIANVQEDIRMMFVEVNKSNLYLAKKSVRKILRYTNKYIKYSGTDVAEIELLMFFCLQLKESGIPYRRNAVFSNMYDQQLKKIRKTLNGLHEDLQFDYAQALEELES